MAARCLKCDYHLEGSICLVCENKRLREGLMDISSDKYCDCFTYLDSHRERCAGRRAQEALNPTNGGAGKGTDSKEDARG